MVRRVPVTILGYRTDVDHLDLICILLSQNRFHDIFSRAYIDLEGLLRIIISCRRHHASYMKNIIRARNSCKDILITHEVTPDHGHGRICQIRFELPAVLLAVACKNPYVETLSSSI